MRTVLLALLLTAPAAQEPELAGLLARMAEVRKPLGDLRANVAYFGPATLKTGLRDHRRWAAGTFVFRAPGDAAWGLKPDRAEHYYSSYLDAGRGIAGAVRADALTLHVPWRLHRPRDGPGRQQNYPYGAEWYRARLDAHTPPVLPMLLAHPEDAPLAVLFDLSPARLAALPSLRVEGTRRRHGRAYVVLAASPRDADLEARKEEARRTWDGLTWMGAEIWVDATTFLIDRLLVTHELASSAPAFRWRRDYQFSRRERGLPTSIGITTSLESDESKSWTARLELSELRENAGVEDRELGLAAPADRVPRDWFPQAHEKQAADDPSGWLSRGALHLHRFENAEAEAAFRKVVALRPAAEEGYIGAVYALQARRPPADREIVVLLEAALRAGAASDLVRWELAHREPARAKEQLAALLKKRGEDPRVLEATAELVAKEPAEKRALWLRAVQAELAGAERTAAWRLWLASGPGDGERAAMLKVLEAGTAKADLLRARIWQLELLGAKGRKAALAALALIGKGPSPDDLHALDRLIQRFRTDKDADGMKRLAKAFAGRDDDDAETARLILEAEELVASGGPEEWLLYFDERLTPPERNRLDRHAQPCARFLQALKREKRLVDFLDRLLKTPPSDERRRFHDYAAKSLAAELLEGAEKEQYFLRIRALETGKGPGTGELAGLAEQFALEKKWPDARARAAELLSRNDASGNDRARAFRVQARGHEAAGEWAPAAAACARALAEKDVYPRAGHHVLRARMLLRAGDAKGAAADFAAAFDDVDLEVRDALRRRRFLSLVDEIPRLLPEQAERKALLDGVGELPGAGRLALRALLRRAVHDPAGAADAWGRLLALRPDDPAILRLKIGAHAAAGQVGPALDDRARLVAVDAELLDAADAEILGACSRAKDLAGARRLAEALAAGPLASGSVLRLASALALAADEALIERVDVALSARPGDEWLRFHARYPAAFAWHALGKTEKAVSIYEGATAEAGWSPVYVQLARAWIAQWRKEAAER